MPSRVKRVKGKNAHEMRIQKWRKTVLKERGPVGLALLAEVLNWDMDRLDPAGFKETDYRRDLICIGASRLGLLPSSDDWRPKFRDIQSELRQDLRGLLHSDPVQKRGRLPAASDAKSLSRMSVADVMQSLSQRDRNFMDLLVKLNSSFSWIESLRSEISFGRGNSISYGLEGEQPFTRAVFEIDGESFGVRSQVIYRERSYQAARARLYRIVFDSLKSGEISTLRSCRNGQCQKFFIGRRQECSEKCRSHINNQSRGPMFKNRYKTQKKERLAKARRLLSWKTPFPLSKIARLTHLTRKAIERAFPKLI